MRTLMASVLGMALVAGSALAVPPKSEKNVRLTGDEWKGVPTTSLQAGEIDRLVAKEQAAAKITPSPKTTDEQFLRRVMLDLTGRLPLPADVTEFAADTDPNKRAKVIDKLLDSDDYAKHWARYWRDVFAAKITDRRAQAMTQHFEAWLLEQFKQNRPWDGITRDILTSTGQLPFRYGPMQEPDPKNGAAFFLLAYIGNDAINDRTAETSRIFLGIQIQCAQCHDHPFDGWKRAQFHELAGYFARTQERPMREDKRVVGFEIGSRPFGEHSMPDLENPNKGTVTLPKFLDGSSISPRSGDVERRRALADAITSKNNFYFSAALVNRLWGELMGQAFRQPIDDLGPGKDVVMPAVLARISASFAGNKFDIKNLLRTICNSETYQRQIRPGESSQHLQFAGAFPTRLHAEALWQSLVTVLGAFGPAFPGGPGMGPGMGPFAGRGGIEGQFKEEFRFDPSLPSDEVESSIPQALMLMNNPQIQQKIKAQGTNLLGRILSAYPRDEDALRMVYLRTLSRKPTDREAEKNLGYVRKVGHRAEAYEDILWALLNGTEFQTKR
ncbi:MAG: DUF1549 domain-containing protein [Gemmataceae bacterium]